MCAGPDLTHGSQMIGEWEQQSDRAGSIMESGCCESQLSKNNHNMYSTPSEGQRSVEKNTLDCEERKELVIRIKAFVMLSVIVLVCVHRERVSKDRERKQFRNVHCHCSAGEGCLKSTAQKHTAGGSAIWEQKQSCCESCHPHPLKEKTTSRTYHS